MSCDNVSALRPWNASTSSAEPKAGIVSIALTTGRVLIPASEISALYVVIVDNYQYFG
jgi:hypothetical protein